MADISIRFAAFMAGVKHLKSKKSLQQLSDLYIVLTNHPDIQISKSGDFHVDRQTCACAQGKIYG